ncbi:MAG: hypothetical protein R3F02_02460 [Thiolinea sp.]
MSQDKLKKLAIKYQVNDIPGSMIPGSRLVKILENIENSDNQITSLSLEYLRKNGLLALFHYAENKISYSEFLKQAKIELPKRLEVAEAKAIKEKADQEERRKALLAKSKETMRKIAERRQAYADDPRTIEKIKQRRLKEKYGFHFFIEQEYYNKILHIIRKLDSKLRLSENDLIWLTTDGEEYFTPELKKNYHKYEAKHYEKIFYKTNNAWSAVNASSHYRKCGLSNKSLTLLNKIEFTKIRNKHLRSAICTTKGGSMRDLGEYHKAIELGTEAHSYDSKSFHPCTLLGAVNYEIGNFAEGNVWFQKAEKRGANTENLDNELKYIYNKSNKGKKNTLRKHLLSLDPYRYSWLKQ